LQDNLLPVSCKGQDWQGGLGLTLVDSLDMLLLLNRRGDVQSALEQLRQVLSFDKDVKVRLQMYGSQQSVCIGAYSRHRCSSSGVWRHCSRNSSSSNSSSRDGAGAGLV
jgi:hypothetical protein